MNTRSDDRDKDSFDEAPAHVGGILEATDEDMTAINRFAREPLRADEVWVFAPVVSTNALDAFFTRQAESSMRNYADDAQAGNPLLVGHDTGSLPIGRSFAGRVEMMNDVMLAVVRDYLVRGHEVGGQNTDQIARGIQAGTLSDMSIGFGGVDKWFKCAICERNLFDAECEHVPGVEYDAVRAFAWVEDARMTEHSIVYSGATPGAVIRKARSMAETGRVSPMDIVNLERSFRVRLTGDERPYLNEHACRLKPPEKYDQYARITRKHNGKEYDVLRGRKKGTDDWEDQAFRYPRKTWDADEARAHCKTHDGSFEAASSSRIIACGIMPQADKEATMNGRKLLDWVRSLVGTDRVADPGGLTDETPAEEVLNSAGNVIKADAELAQAARAVGMDSADKLQTLKAQAKLGETYRAELITDTLAEGVRALSTDFDVERWTRTLAAASIEDIRAYKADYDKVAIARLGPGGRQTTPADGTLGIGADEKDPAKLREQPFDKLTAEQQKIALDTFGK